MSIAVGRFVRLCAACNCDVGAKQGKLTRLLMTEAPIRLIMCTATSTAKTTTRSEAIFSDFPL